MQNRFQPGQTFGFTLCQLLHRNLSPFCHYLCHLVFGNNQPFPLTLFFKTLSCLFQLFFGFFLLLLQLFCQHKVLLLHRFLFFLIQTSEMFLHLHQTVRGFVSVQLHF